MPNPFTFKPGKHNGEKVLFILFEKNYDLIQRVKKIPGSTWSQSKKVWYVLDTENNRSLFKLEPLSSSLPSAE